MEKRSLPQTVMKSLDDFAVKMKDVYGDGLISVVLYGSAESGEYDTKRSNINVAVILKDARLENIARSSDALRVFPGITPVFFTENFVRESADVFPVEFLDIKENHRLLYGLDIFKDLVIDIKNLRFQCEQELKSKIINIKKAYSVTRTTTGRRELLYKVFNSVMHILRNVVRLKGHEPSYRKEDLLGEISRELKIDIMNLRRVLEAKAGKISLSADEVAELFNAFIDDLENIADIVDKI